MNNFLTLRRGLLPGVAVLLTVAASSAPEAQVSPRIALPDTAISDVPLLRAAETLAIELGADPGMLTSHVVYYDPGGSAPTGDVIVEFDSGIPAEGYSLSGYDPVIVEGLDAEGGTNGLHGLRRRLIVGGVTSTPLPSAIDFDVDVTPAFERRGVLVPAFTNYLEGVEPILMNFEEWKHYVDMLRLLNADHLQVAPFHFYDPNDERTKPHKAHFEILSDVMDYCHEVGMEFHLVLSPGFCSDWFFWDNYDRSTGTHLSPNNLYFGRAASFTKLASMSAVTAALETMQREVYEWFEDADAFVFIWNEQGAEHTSPLIDDPQAWLETALEHAEEQITAVGSDARIIFWAWLHDTWYRWRLFDPDYTGTGDAFNDPPNSAPDPSLFFEDTFDILEDLESGGTAIEWLQESSRVYPRFDWYAGIESAYSPGPLPVSVSDPLGEATRQGREVTDYLYQNHVEHFVNSLPRPILDDTIEELIHASELITVGMADVPRATGVTGYRLTPATRRLNDYITLRIAEDAALLASPYVDYSGSSPDYSVLREHLLRELAFYLYHGNSAHYTDPSGASDPTNVLHIMDSIDVLEAARDPFAITNLSARVADRANGGSTNFPEKIIDMLAISLTGRPRFRDHFDLCVLTYTLEAMAELTDLVTADEYLNDTTTGGQTLINTLIAQARKNPLLRTLSSQTLAKLVNARDIVRLVNEIKTYNETYGP